jgi:hypothetical protein
MVQEHKERRREGDELRWVEMERDKGEYDARLAEKVGEVLMGGGRSEGEHAQANGSEKKLSLVFWMYRTTSMLKSLRH